MEHGLTPDHPNHTARQVTPQGPFTRAVSSPLIAEVLLITSTLTLAVLSHKGHLMEITRGFRKTRRAGSGGQGCMGLLLDCVIAQILTQVLQGSESSHPGFSFPAF